jgi:hypothetical protein
MNDAEIQPLIVAYNAARFQLTLAAEKVLTVGEGPDGNAIIRAYILAHAKFDVATVTLQDAQAGQY